jgi:ATP-dependent helicase/nuclease subunit B
MVRGNIFTIPPGAPFLKVLASAIAAGRLVDGLRYDPTDPLSLARATIYLPTRRAARVLRSEFVDLIGGSAAILPVIRPLGESDDDAGYFEPDPEGDLDHLPPISPVLRLIELGRLILLWRNRLPEKLREIHKDSPLAAPASPADAIWLAKGLSDLIDAVETEETGWDRLDAIRLGDRAIWWQLTGEFLKIARDFWPARLEELHRSSPALNRNLSLRAEARRLAAGQAGGPVIVAGSTGSIPATADLIRAIYRLPEGAVVLPGLDQTMDEAEWRLAGAIMADGTLNTNPASRSHPQYGLVHLLGKLGVTRDAVTALATEDDVIADRGLTVTAAFTPADATIDNLAWRKSIGAERLKNAVSDIALVEAGNEREEALAIAIALKLALHDPAAGPESQAALVTPDRNLARRVAIELRRFGIEADDSAGAPLAASPQGELLRLALDTILRPGDPAALASLIKHPLVRLGRTADALSPAADRFEMICLRGGTHVANIAESTTLARASIDALKAQTYAKTWQTPLLGAEAAQDALSLATALEAAVAPLANMLVATTETGLRGEFGLGDWARATGEVLEHLCRDGRDSLESLWSGDDGDALAGLLRELMASAGTITATGPQWVDIIDAMLAGMASRPKSTGHPRIFIWGALEARLQSVDTLVLGGLNEGSWPRQTANNPFLSRVMQAEIGLEPPERRIGQAAHDFMMALGTRKLILTRALRQDGAPSVASRFLQRLVSVIGEDDAAAVRRRGQIYRDYADQVDLGDEQSYSPRPEPRPPAALQPVRYSFSEAGRLRRDPYSVYARRVLRLDPVDGFNEDPGAAERGTIYHRIIELFISGKHDPGAADAAAILEGIVARVFDEAGLPAHIDAVWRPRFAEVGREFLAYEAERRGLIAESLVERGAKVKLPGSDLLLTGRADRIDLRRDGKADIIDYKTGLSPSMKEARVLLDPQLALEAAALRLGGFKDLKPMETDNLIYVRLRPGSGFKAETVNNENQARVKAEDVRTTDDLIERSLSQLIRLTEALRTGKAGFKSRVAPFKDRDYGGEYDHLARVAEWSSADNEEGDDGD